MTKRVILPVWLLLLVAGLFVSLSGLMFVSAHPPTGVQACSSLSITTDKDNYYTGENINVHVRYDPARNDCSSSPSHNPNLQHIVVVDANGAAVSSWTTNSSLDKEVSWSPGQLTVGREFTVRACVTGAQYGWEDCASKNVLVGTGWAIQPANLLVGVGTIGLGVLVVATTIGALALGREYSLMLPQQKIEPALTHDADRPKG